MFHFAARIRQFFFDQHAEVCPDHLVTISLCRLVVERRKRLKTRPCVIAEESAILLDLAKDPGIRRGSAPDHDCVASSHCNHRAGVFRRAYIAVADDRYLHRIFYRSNPLPSRIAAIALLPRSCVQCDRAQAAGFSDFRQFHAHDLFVIPAGAKLHGEGDFYCSPNRFEDPADVRQIAQQPRSTVALNHFFGGTSEIQIYKIEAQVFDNAGSLSHDLRIAAKQLRRNGMLVFVEMEISLGLLVFSAQHAIGGRELGHDQAASAEIADEAAEDRIRNARHGREHGCGSNIHGSNLQARRNDGQPFLLRTRRDRIIPKLTHRSILTSYCRRATREWKAKPAVHTCVSAEHACVELEGPGLSKSEFWEIRVRRVQQNVPFAANSR